ncbi:hypothetical protein OQA88_2932, partial [Cercophora sp. LCS_1]
MQQYGCDQVELSVFLWDDRFVRSRDSGSDEGSNVRLWLPDKFRRILEELAVRHLGSKLNISMWRHIAISIGRRYLHNAFGKAGDDVLYGDSDTEDNSAVPDQALDLQAGHSSYTAGMVYGREIEQGNTGLAVRQEQFRKVSILWHRFFGFGSYDVGQGRKPRQELFEAERYAVRQRRLDRLQQINLKGCLQQLLWNPEAEFRGNQQAVLEAVIRGQTPILQITGTGGGKSLTFLLPAYGADEGTTVVIVPFVVLQEDIQARCRIMGIACEIWLAQEVQVVPVLLVLPESFVTKGFADFLNRLSVRYQLDRIVLDECHTVLDASYDFRPDLRAIGPVLNLVGAQLVFLTATMPPRDEEEFWTTLGLPAGKAVV